MESGRECIPQGISMGEWQSTKHSAPADGTVVDTKIDDDKGRRNEARLKKLGRLWYTEDGAMYVYYTPTHWRFSYSAGVKP